MSKATNPRLKEWKFSFAEREVAAKVVDPELRGGEKVMVAVTIFSSQLGREEKITRQLNNVLGDSLAFVDFKESTKEDEPQVPMAVVAKCDRMEQKEVTNKIARALRRSGGWDVIICDTYN